MLPKPNMIGWGTKLLIFAFLILIYAILAAGIWWLGSSTPEYPPIQIESGPEGGAPTLEKYLIPEKDRPI